MPKHEKQKHLNFSTITIFSLKFSFFILKIIFILKNYININFHFEKNDVYFLYFSHLIQKTNFSTIFYTFIFLYMLKYIKF